MEKKVIGGGGAGADFGSAVIKAEDSQAE